MLKILSDPTNQEPYWRLAPPSLTLPALFRPVMTEHALSSAVPDKYLRELTSFDVTLADGQSYFVKVTSFRRQAQEHANCGSVVVLTTSLGEFTLDGEELYHKGSLARASC